MRVLTALFVLTCVSPSLASEAKYARTIVSVGAMGGFLQTMSYGDSRPQSHGVASGQLGLGYRVSGSCWAVVTGQWGGGWADFIGPGVSGKIEQVTWRARAGAEHHVPVGRNCSLFLGAGAEYGETRSWFDGFSDSDEGPRVFAGGGFVRAGVLMPLFGNGSAYAEISDAVQLAHAQHARLRTDLNWLGHSLDVGVGMRWAFGKTAAE